VRRQDFSYDLPEELIAQSPLAERSASRLLVLDGATGALADRGMGDLPQYLRAGDLLVFNDTRVVAARVLGAKPSGGRVEIFLERVRQSEAKGGAKEALVQLRASKPIREGLEIATAGGVVRVLGREDELWRVETPGDALEFFEAWGEVPLPPYIHRTADESDRERYQSIFAREKGAVAAPTASLHFDAPLVAKLQAIGVGCAFVTLHVGAGTFQPLRADDLDAHRMHAERVSVGRATWEAICRTRAAGGRVVAVGTTVVRALESAAVEMSAGMEIGEPAVAQGVGLPPAVTEDVRQAHVVDEKVRQLASITEDIRRAHVVDEKVRQAAAIGEDIRQAPVVAENVRQPPPVADSVRQTSRSAEASVQSAAAWSGETRLFIRPGFKFKVVDAMVTNFHLPESTLLMLVSAFAGRENVLAAYAHAVRERYRFFSYGDAMFVMPVKPTAGLMTPRENGMTTP
jgi:S-adenosylmethionine:tRNA ribosyltransferase-isomerase